MAQTREGIMRCLTAISAAAIAFVISAAPAPAQVARFLTPPDQVVAVKAARMFDSRTGQLVANQVVLIKGERITDVGTNLAIPSGAKLIDLGSATMMPGMIDAHVHVNTGGETPYQRAIIALANAQTDLAAGFTTVLDMDSRGGWDTVDLRDEINAGMVLGPRMQVVGQSLNPRAGNYYHDTQNVRFYQGYTEDKDVNGPWLARAAVREAKLHGVDYIKIYTTQDFVGPIHMWKPDATLVNSPSLTREEVDAIVDEAHRLGLRVACHTYGGDGMKSCIEAGVDAPNHLLELDAAGAQELKRMNLPFVVTLDDLIALEKSDLEATGGRNSRLKLAEQAFKNALAAGVTIVFGSGATSLTIPHGKQANQFAYYVKWGMTPAQALQTAYLPAAHMLNYNWDSQIASLEKGKYADIIAVSGNPLADVGEMEHVRFVMKGGLVIRNDLAPGAITAAAR
jgi:imidazolonepropionase-like amidohydrolase